MTENENKPIDTEDTPKRKLEQHTFTPSQLKEHLRITFGSYKSACHGLGITSGRFHQIFMGVDVPSAPDTIKRYAEAWKVDVTLLTQVFADIQNGQQQIKVDKMVGDFENWRDKMEMC